MKRKATKIFITILLAIAMLAGFGAHSETTSSTSRETLKVGFFAFDGYHMLDDEGNKSGYGYDFIRKVSRYLDVDFEYAGYENSWDDMADMLQRGEIDLVTSAQATYERSEIFDFSKPIGKSSAILTVKSDNESIVDFDFATYNGMRVGMLEGNSRNEDFQAYAQENNFSYVPVYFEMHTDMEEALQNGEVDALITSSLRKTSNERILDEFNTHDFYVMVRKGEKELLKKINYAIDQLNATEGDWQNELENKYYTHESRRYLDFTDREKALIEQYRDGKNKLVVSACLDKKPYAYSENGKAKGILFDYFARLAEYVGVEYEIILPSDRAEYMQWCEENRMDISLDGRFLNEKQIEDKKRTITPVYTVMRLAVVTRRDFDGEIERLAVANAQGPFAIEQNFAQKAKRVDVPTREQAMQAVLDGNADATIVYLYTAQQFVNQDERGLLTYTMLGEPTYNYHLAFTPNVSHELAGIFTKAIYAMPDGEFEQIASEYTSYKAENTDLFTWIKIYPLHTIAVFLVLFLFCLFAILFFEKRKRLLALQASIDRADRANRAKSEFLANVSHDIRTPMNAIVGIAGLMEQESDISPKLRSYIQKIQLSSQHLLGIITDVLDMSKIEANEVVLNKEPIDLFEQLEQVINIISSQAEERGQTFNVNYYDVHHICLIADGAYFRRVLINILSNAVKYTQNGGTINFGIKELAGDNETAKYEFTIEDNGVGMSAEFAERLFEPFVRGESSVTNKVQGTGLGMAIVKSIVSLMNGDIQIQSEPQKGTRITVTLSLERDRKTEKCRKKNADGQASANSNAMLSLDKMKFLCAEDNELNAGILAETLKMHNAECTLCKNGEELVNEFEKSAVGEYDAILTDIQMPVMNGLDAARAIRNSEKPNSRIPIVAMTANAFTEDIRRSIKAGMNAHIAKPIDVSALKKILCKLLGADYKPERNTTEADKNE